MSTEYYKLKHKPTGLYYKPNKGTGSNLSTRGKVYDNNYMYNQLTNTHPEWKDKPWYNVNHYYSLNIFATRWKEGKAKKDDSVVDIGWKIHTGEIPVEIKSDRSKEFGEQGICIDMTIWSHPEDWEKEYIK